MVTSLKANAFFNDLCDNFFSPGQKFQSVSLLVDIDNLYISTGLSGMLIEIGFTFQFPKIIGTAFSVSNPAFCDRNVSVSETLQFKNVRRNVLLWLKVILFFVFTLV
jgi:hypothetical protein